mgnify:CR=1 FL=1
MGVMGRLAAVKHGNRVKSVSMCVSDYTFQIKMMSKQEYLWGRIIEKKREKESGTRQWSLSSKQVEVSDASR